MKKKYYNKCLMVCLGLMLVLFMGCALPADDPAWESGGGGSHTTPDFDGFFATNTVETVDVD